MSCPALVMMGQGVDLDSCGEGRRGVCMLSLSPPLLPPFPQGVPSSALREICLLKELKHKNIVR